MKVKKITANNRKKAFEIVTAHRVYEFPYSRLTLKPTERAPVESVFSDPEIGHEGFTYRLANGKEDTIVMDRVLEYVRDPEYLRRDLLYRLTLEAQRRLERLGISKREIVRRMQTTPTQLYRLMDQKNTKKSLDQMVKLLAALDCTVELVVAKAA